MRSPLTVETDSGTPQREGARLLLMSAYLLLIITCYTTTKAARDSLFIIEVGPAQLPILYMLTAAAMALISAIYPRALRRMGLYSLVRVTSLTSVVSLLVFWKLIEGGGRVSLYLLYIWVSLFGAITASQAWSLASHVFDAREARRSFAWIGLGGVVGGILGGSLARVIAPWQGTEMLFPVCAVLMAVTIFLLYGLSPREKAKGDATQDAQPSAPDDSGLTVLQRIRESRYLSSMVVLLLAGVLVEAFVDYEFKVIAHSAFDSRDHLTSFFGTIASYGGVLALFVQLLLTGPLLRRFGVGAAILMLPAALLGAFLLVAARPTLWAVSVLKLADGCLSYSVHRSGMELLYVPVPTKLRASVKALIDLLVDRVGRAGGGLLLLVLTAGLALSVPSLSIIAATGLAVWIGIAVFIRREYVQAFRVALEKKVIEPESFEGTLDSTTIDALVKALSSPDERQVLYALDMLSVGHPSRWSRYLPSLLEHPSPSVRCRALALLTEGNVFSPSSAESRLLDPELDVRVEAVRHLSALRAGERSAGLRNYLFHIDYRVVLAAIHCIAKYRPADGDLIDEPLIEGALRTTGEHSLSAKTAAARALAISRLPRAHEFLDQLLRDSSVDVIQEAIRTAGEIRYVEAIPLLIPMLARAPLRREAREALLKIGEPALRELQVRFRDEQAPLEVRMRIPKVLSFFGGREIADYLLDGFRRYSPRLDISILRALNRMRAQTEGLEFDSKRISELIRIECGAYQRLAGIRTAIGNDQPKEGNASAAILDLLESTIGERLAENVERVFRLLHLIYPPADIHSVYFSFNSRPTLRASAVEFLDNLLDPSLRPLVLPLVDQPEGGSPRPATEESLSQQDALQILLSEGDELLKAIAAELASRWRQEGRNVDTKIA